MIRPIIHDPIFLSRAAKDATEADLPIAHDLEETLRGHLEECVGMAANMIGESKRIIAFVNENKKNAIEVMLNPRITDAKGEYQAQEGCLCLSGTRAAKRYAKITVVYQNTRFQTITRHFSGYTAQIIQHEMDHTNGVLI